MPRPRKLPRLVALPNRRLHTADWRLLKRTWTILFRAVA